MDVEVLGLEVTEPDLAQACSLGNIDPQHLGGDASTAAIEAALTHPVPPAGSALAVLRQDADALGAAAVLRIRQRGEKLDAAARARVGQIAEADKEASGPWPGPRPAARNAADLLRSTSAVEAMCMNFRRPLEDRVAAVEGWILDGALPDREEISERLRQEADAAMAALDVQVCDGIAVVTGAHRLAMSAGYRHAPVVMATNPAFRWQGGPEHTKHNVARWNSAHPMDWAGMLADLRGREPGWGGSSSICGSPQGTGSTLTQQEVLGIVARHL
ncbi:hypothetical protein ACFQHO_53545 [Actinomadura yumaensis]